MLRNKNAFSMAGIWRKEKNGSVFAILTTEPNSLVSKIHNRMPIILLPDNENKWLSLNSSDEDLEKITRPYSPKLMKALAIPGMISSSGYDPT